VKDSPSNLFEGQKDQRTVSDTRWHFAMAGSYVAEIERMQEEVMGYLTRHASQPAPT
jgi:hypothetical protein